MNPSDEAAIAQSSRIFIVRVVVAGRSCGGIIMCVFVVSKKGCSFPAKLLQEEKRWLSAKGDERWIRFTRVQAGAVRGFVWPRRVSPKETTGGQWLQRLLQDANLHTNNLPSCSSDRSPHAAALLLVM